MKTAICFLLVVVAVVAGAPSNNRIVGGIAVTTAAPGAISQFPYVVSLEDKDSHFCGGFIYSPQWVVTTASCLEGRTIADLKVVAGSINVIELEPTEEKIPFFKVYLNPDYLNVTKKNDIALIELAKNITLDGITKAYIAYNEVNIDDIPAGSPPSGLTMGWGSTTLGGGFSQRLRYGEMEMIETATCGSFGTDRFNLSTTICSFPKATTAPDTTISPCSLDEGAPLVQTFDTSLNLPTIVVGVLSERDENCDPANPDLYTRISVYYAWLKRVAGEQYGTIYPPPVL